MKHYPKIQTLYKRDDTKRIILGDWTTPELDYLQNNTWEFTEKVDGTSIVINWDQTIREIGGHTAKSQIPTELYAKLDALFPVAKLAGVFPPKDAPYEVALYGEGYGGKIQKGGKYRPDVSLVLFDVRIGRWWMKYPDMCNIAEQLGIDVVPHLGYGTLRYAVRLVETGFNSKWGEFPAEGIVARTPPGLLARNGERLICKIKTKDFKHEQTDIS